MISTQHQGGEWASNPIPRPLWISDSRNNLFQKGTYHNECLYHNHNTRGNEVIMWTLFWDMHSGGGTKEPPFEKIYIEAPEQEAISVFYSKFGHSPHRVSCTCCGEDYSIDSNEDFAQLSGFHRGCDEEDGKYVERPCPRYSLYPYQTVEQYIGNPNVLVIHKVDILDEWRHVTVPQEGYVWQ